MGTEEKPIGGGELEGEEALEVAAPTGPSLIAGVKAEVALQDEAMPRAEADSLRHQADQGKLPEVPLLTTLTVEQASALLHYHINIIQNMCHTGRIVAWMSGKRWVIPAQKFLEDLQAGRLRPDFRRREVKAEMGTKVKSASGKEMKRPSPKEEGKPAPPVPNEKKEKPKDNGWEGADNIFEGEKPIF